MKQIEAHWEKRNLGVECVELGMDRKDSLSQFIEFEENTRSTAYVVVKVPQARFDLYSYLNQQGYTFVEASINFRLIVKEAKLNSLQQRLSNEIQYSEMEQPDLEFLFTEIGNGLFQTDRIALDPYFTREMASNRYINWIRDEMQRGAQVYKVVYKDQSIGFFTMKLKDENVYYPFLAGVYNQFSESGLGFATIRKPIEEVMRRGGQLISTFASSNNHPVIRAHIQQGFTINDLQYVFVKHNL